MRLRIEPYLAQVAHWPQTGRHILAQYDAEVVIVYQAYRPAIGHYAAQHSVFGGGFSKTRMSWIKPNFLWMMYRSGWGTKVDQEVTLAISLRRSGFEEILAQAVPSLYDPRLYPEELVWKADLARSDVRLQWDPDHDPSGNRVERRAIQLGLRGDALVHYAGDWILEIEDISDFVAGQRESLASGGYALLETPSEQVYPVSNPAISTKIGLTL